MTIWLTRIKATQFVVISTIAFSPFHFCKRFDTMFRYVITLYLNFWFRNPFFPYSKSINQYLKLSRLNAKKKLNRISSQCYAVAIKMFARQFLKSSNNIVSFQENFHLIHHLKVLESHDFVSIVLCFFGCCCCCWWWCWQIFSRISQIFAMSCSFKDYIKYNPLTSSCGKSDTHTQTHTRK